MPAAFFVSYNTIILLSAMLVIIFSIAVFISGVITLRNGYWPARYFLIAWMALLLGVSAYALKGMGLLPVSFITEYGLKIGSVIEMSLLSMGLADRIHHINMENEEAKRHAMEVEQLHQETRLHSARLETELLKHNI